MSILCRLNMHKWSGEGEFVRDDSLVESSGFVVVLEAGYFRYYCARCGKASDTSGKDND